jgi:hypothetical protein
MASLVILTLPYTSRLARQTVADAGSPILHHERGSGNKSYWRGRSSPLPEKTPGFSAWSLLGCLFVSVLRPQVSQLERRLAASMDRIKPAIAMAS